MIKIHALYGQRHESYPGEYLPELLEAIDELTRETHPDWMQEKKRLHEDTGAFETVAWVELRVPDHALMAILRPKPVSAMLVMPGEKAEEEPCRAKGRSYSEKLKGDLNTLINHDKKPEEGKLSQAEGYMRIIRGKPLPKEGSDG